MILLALSQAVVVILIGAVLLMRGRRRIGGTLIAIGLVLILVALGGFIFSLF